MSLSHAGASGASVLSKLCTSATAFACIVSFMRWKDHVLSELWSNPDPRYPWDPPEPQRMALSCKRAFPNIHDWKSWRNHSRIERWRPGTRCRARRDIALVWAASRDGSGLLCAVLPDPVATIEQCPIAELSQCGTLSLSFLPCVVLSCL